MRRMSGVIWTGTWSGWGFKLTSYGDEARYSRGRIISCPHQERPRQSPVFRGRAEWPTIRLSTRLGTSSQWVRIGKEDEKAPTVVPLHPVAHPMFSTNRSRKTFREHGVALVGAERDGGLGNGRHGSVAVRGTTVKASGHSKGER